MIRLLPVCIMALVVFGCGDAPPPSGKPPQGQSVGAAGSAHAEWFDDGRFKIGFGDDFASVEALRIENGVAQLTLRAPGHGGRLEFVPIRMAADRAEVRFDLRAERDTMLMTSVPFRNLEARPVTAASALSLLLDPVEVPLNFDEGTSVSLAWLAPPADENLLLILNPKILRSSDAKPKPDMLLLCADALRYDYAFGARGEGLADNLRALANRGLVYDRAFSPGSWTLPAMSSVMTGLWPLQHGAGERPGGEIERGVFAGKFPSHLQTFADILRESGYFTVFIHSNAVVDVSGMSREGFDLSVNALYRSADELHRHLREVLRHAPASKPVCVLLHYLDIHHYRQWHFARRFGKSPFFANPDQALASYEDGIRAFDQSLLELAATWNEFRNLDDTLMILFADHGENLADPGYEETLALLFENPLKSMGLPPFSHGRSMDEVLLHVPLFVRRPVSDRWEAGRVGTPVSLVDILPTLLREAGIEGRAGKLPGIPLERNYPSGMASRIMFSDFQIAPPELSVVRRDHFKLVINRTTGERWLLDLALLDGTGPELRARVVNEAVERELQEARDNLVEQSRLVFGLQPRPVIEQDDRVIREMRAMGYL